MRCQGRLVHQLYLFCSSSGSRDGAAPPGGAWPGPLLAGGRGIGFPPSLGTEEAPVTPAREPAGRGEKLFALEP